jgi:sterol desaturase/sphingolipid hydroxylase (fatty acid hydroxylase superfamily)
MFSSFDWSESESLQQAAYGGLCVILPTIGATIVLEFLSLDTVQGVWQQPNGTQLYWTAALLNIFNHLVIGVPVYMFAAIAFCNNKSVENIERVLQVTWVIVGHALQYYAIHKAFHKSPLLYQKFHRFHHRFHTHVPPSSANAVTPGEYVIAYVLPFVLPVLLRPTATSSLKIAMGIISLANLLVHTPKLEALSTKWVPSFLVSTNDHLEHHRKLNSHYASPTVNVDNILNYFSKLIYHHDD